MRVTADTPASGGREEDTPAGGGQAGTPAAGGRYTLHCATGGNTYLRYGRGRILYINYTEGAPSGRQERCNVCINMAMAFRALELYSTFLISKSPW